MSADGDESGGGGSGSGHDPEDPMGPGGALVPRENQAPSSPNEAAAILLQTPPDTPPQFAMVYAGKKYKFAATASAGGLAAGLVGLASVLVFGTPANVLSLCIFLGAVVGGCGVSLVMHGQMAQLRDQLGRANAEIDRKAADYKELLGKYIKAPASSVRPSSGKTMLKPQKLRKEKK